MDKTDEIIALLDRQHLEIKEDNKKAKENYDREINQMIGRVAELEAALASRHNGHGGGGGGTESLGATVINNSEFKSFGGSRKRGKIAIEVKTVTTVGTSAGALIPPDRREPVLLPQQQLTIRDLLGSARTQSNAVEYPLETVRPSGAAVVTEGTKKAESDIAFELKTVPIRTIAHFIKTSKQVLDDAPVLQSTIDGELRYGLKLVEEAELLNGDGTGQHILGLIPQATAFVGGIPLPDLPNRFDVLLQAIAQSEEALLPATGIVLNNLDLTALRSIKSTTGEYIGDAGPFSGPITTLWGRQVVGTPSMARGEFLVGAFRDGATIFDRWDAQILISTENEDDFLRNLVAILCEERIGLAVKRPAAFVHGEFGVYT